ncbi:hypothetical protein AGMMS49957_11430 [Synergistales bacterium]|nr:hypothetical protein AGMMS49957_11430 [Synergistales bacterium]
MTSAVIDMGSNTVRLCVFEYNGGEIETLFSQKEAVGLAGYVRNGFMERGGVHQVCEVLRGFRDLALKFVPMNDIRVFATASLRNVNNKSDAISIIYGETGLSPEELSGDEEAYLDFIGVTHGTKLSDGFLIDIGGASTELVSFSNGVPTEKISLAVGCLGLYTKFMRGPLVAKSEKSKMRYEIRDLFNAFDWNNASVKTLIGIGGTARAALKMSQALFGAPQNGFPAKHVKAIRRMLEKSEPGVYQTLYKNAPERVLTLYPGLLILEEAVKRLGCEELHISKYGVREGFFIERVLKLNADNR